MIGGSMRQKVKQVDDVVAKFKEIAKTLATEMMKTLPETAFGVESKKHKQTRFEHEAFKNLKALREQLNKGVYAMFLECWEMVKNGPKADAELVKEDLHKFTEKNFSAEIIKSWEQGILLKDHFGIAGRTMEALYQAAKKLYEKRSLEEASGAFFALALLDSENHAFWMGRGACEQLLAQYEQALFAYGVAACRNPFDPMCHFWAAKCYVALGDTALAMNSFELALLVIRERKDQEPLKLSIQREIEKIQNKK
jgi:type III secretion system low calcium response chaperone LcrH/SycD